ncbi:MAG TPA: hypothetical protein VNG95_04915, partial [Gemmatimonadales bacterium]|nr:hypothetical protein [Gemmatimonadales bacterium]
MTLDSTFASLPTICPACGSEIAPTLVACPSCGRLLHGDQLKSLAARADQAARDGDDSAEIALWREALSLLPGNSRQYTTITARVAELSQRIDGGNANAPTSSMRWLSSATRALIVAYCRESPGSRPNASRQRAISAL